MIFIVVERILVWASLFSPFTFFFVPLPPFSFSDFSLRPLDFSQSIALIPSLPPPHVQNNLTNFLINPLYGTTRMIHHWLLLPIFYPLLTQSHTVSIVNSKNRQTVDVNILNIEQDRRVQNVGWRKKKSEQSDKKSTYPITFYLSFLTYYRHCPQSPIYLALPVLIISLILPFSHSPPVDTPIGIAILIAILDINLVGIIMVIVFYWKLSNFGKNKFSYKSFHLCHSDNL